MADLNPIGSEKLQGMDKINRILEISRYNEPSQNINESKADYSIQLADGNYYGIVNEKNGYIVKKGINESELDYIEPMKNRKYYKSYSQAMKKINLLAGELNRIHEHTENINLIGEQKKFVLKTPESETPPPAPEAGMSNLGGSSEPSGDEIDLNLDLGMEDSGGESEELDLGMEDSELPPLDGGISDSKEDDEDVSFKLVQKLTGKLGQKLRTLESNEGMSSEDIKYVLNSIISAVNLDSLSEEDLEDILGNFEEDEEGEFDTEIDLDSGDEELDLDMDVEEEPAGDEELSEGNFFLRSPETGMYSDEMDRSVGDDYFDFEYDEEDVIDFDDLMSKLPDNQKIFSNDDTGRGFFNKYKEKFPETPYKLRKRKMSPIDNVLDEVFTESKIDKVLSKYFVISEEEEKETKTKNVRKFITEKVNKVKVKSEIKEMSETLEQQLTSEFIMKENKHSKFLGKTNKNNLVFEVGDSQVKVSPNGELL